MTQISSFENEVIPTGVLTYLFVFYLQQVYSSFLDTVVNFYHPI